MFTGKEPVLRNKLLAFVCNQDTHFSESLPVLHKSPTCSQFDKDNTSSFHLFIASSPSFNRFSCSRMSSGTSAQIYTCKHFIKELTVEHQECPTNCRSIYAENS